jgi:hypothetical protein
MINNLLGPWLALIVLKLFPGFNNMVKQSPI